MNTLLSFKEDHISQIPALMLLEKLGYEYLSPSEALALRSGNVDNVLLEPILRKQLKQINSIRLSSVKTSVFSEQNIENGIEALRNVAMDEGFLAASQTVYDLLTAGKTLEQSIDGDKKSFTMQYIDWANPKNNVYHVTEEFAVMRSGSSETYRPDIVLFVNGIPLCVIECKRPDIKNSLEQAISQTLRNQKEDGIRKLFMYSALVMAVNTQDASYATTATPEKFWSKWKEQFTSPKEEQEYETTLTNLVNEKKLNEKLFGERYHYVKAYFETLHEENIKPSAQDSFLYSLCRPERLLQMMFRFTLFDSGTKKVARYQQFFAVNKTLERVKDVSAGKRQGGVIWHTQGSGKSLTMVMLAQAIMLEPTIKNPKIILVTDRTDLDKQLTGTFKKCGCHVENANTGKQLTELLESKGDAVITTIINKFETAVKQLRKPLEGHDIFALIDEGHRSQYGEMGIKMQKALPNACFIAMTGTPLMKSEKNTAQKFGGIIEPIYTVNQAVEDKAVVPLLYEGRLVPQTVREETIDRYFERICEWMTEAQRVDMKKKFSRADQINQGEQRIYAIAWDISQHYKDNWQGSKFKAQLVTARKSIAIKYKQFFDEIGIVNTEVLITSPDTREGEDNAFDESKNIENAFWHKMMNEHGTSARYESNLINRFKNGDTEIIIVVDKLLTGFDEPKNAVIYFDRKLKEHTLLQAIARVNRVCDDKDFGYIIDYCGVLEELNNSLALYNDVEIEDIENSYNDIIEEVAKLPQRHAEVWDIFKEIDNKQDLEAFGALLRAIDLRERFYEKLSAFARTLKIALSSIDFHKQTPEKQINDYKRDLTMFLRLRNAVQMRYSDKVDYKQYEGQIQKLIDKHVESGEVEIITEQVNIFDKEKFAKEVEKVMGKAAKADTIATRTAKHITENMDLDPAFYKKFSQLLQETIKEYEQGRIDEVLYLQRVNELMEKVLSHTDSSIPAEIQTNNTARAYFGLSLEVYNQVITNDEINTTQLALDTAKAIDKIISRNIVVDWQNNNTLIGQLKIKIEDYLIDEVKKTYQIPLTFDHMDIIIDKCIEVAKRWTK